MELLNKASKAKELAYLNENDLFHIKWPAAFFSSEKKSGALKVACLCTKNNSNHCDSSDISSLMLFPLCG